MDGQRFDQLTRLLASGTPRRRILKGVAGGALGLLGLRAASSVRAGGGGCFAEPGDHCTMDDHCCQGFCSDQFVCYCEDPDEPLLGCSCVTGTEDPCGDTTLLCCAQVEEPGAPGVCTPASVGCDPLGPCEGVTCEEPLVLDEETCECVCPPPTVPCGDGQCAHCGALFSVDPETCECVCETVCDDPRQLDEETCTCVCPPPTSPCDNGDCLHCGAIFQVDPATCTCICPGTEACPCEDNSDCSGGLVCCDDPNTGEGSCRASCEGECALPGQACLTDDDCCQGSCSDEGVCYCEDPSRPIIGCVCTTGTESPCGDTTAVCCPTTDTPGGPGICVSASVGCEPHGDECVTGTEDACPDDFECCALPGSPPGGDGICIPVGTQCARQGCQPAGTACLYDSECCVGTCGEDGFCFCEDPKKPALNCPCDPSEANVCGEGYVCCATDGGGICTLTSVGCKDDDGGGGATQTPLPSLPSTGIGSVPDGEDGGWLAPVALAGAGAALVASRLIRRSTEAEAEAKATEE